MKFQDQRCAYLFSALQICSLFFIVVSLIVFMFLHKFCDFFYSSYVCTVVCIKPGFPDEDCICAVPQEIYFNGGGLIFCFLPEL